MLEEVAIAPLQYRGSDPRNPLTPYYTRDAWAALVRMDGTDVCGNRIKVEWAKSTGRIPRTIEEIFESMKNVRFHPSITARARGSRPNTGTPQSSDPILHKRCSGGNQEHE